MAKEKPRAGGKWTESRFWQFVRSGLRSMSRRWPPIYETLSAAKRPCKKKGRQRVEYQCSACKRWHARKNVQVHHIEECGKLNSIEDVATFLSRLFCESDKLAVVCRKCHDEIH